MTQGETTRRSHDSGWDHMLVTWLRMRSTCQIGRDVYLMLVSCWPCCPSVLISSWMLIPWSNKQLDMVFSTCVWGGGEGDSRSSTNTQHPIFEGIMVHVLFIATHLLVAMVTYSLAVAVRWVQYQVVLQRTTASLLLLHLLLLVLVCWLPWEYPTHQSPAGPVAGMKAAVCVWRGRNEHVHACV